MSKRAGMPQRKGGLRDVQNIKTRKAICALVGLMNDARERKRGYMTRGRGCRDLTVVQNAIR